MAITGAIPLPQSMMDAFLDTMDKSAKIRQERAKANLPFGGANVKGPAGQVLGLQMMKMMYGEDSPEYKQASDAFNLSQQSTGSRVNYQNALANNMPLRYTTPEGRGLIEQSNVSQGASPAGTPAGQPVVPGAPNYQSPAGSPQDTANQYGLERIKKNVPSTLIQRNLLGKNMETTLNSINPDHLTSYSGVGGLSELMKDKIQSGLLNNPSDKYQKYNSAMVASSLLGKQIRQFFGDSITPTVQAKLQTLTDPSSWDKDPETAKKNFLQAKSILMNEYHNTQKTMTDPSVYKAESATPQLAPGTKAPQIKPNLTDKGLAVLYKGDKEYHLPPKLMKQALSEGFSLTPGGQ